MTEKDFSWNLKKLRTEAGLKQSDLAGMTGISQKTLSSYETGRTEPNMGDATKIARALNCSLDKLAGNKARNVGDITYEDILVKLNDLSMDELLELGPIAIELHDQKQHLMELERQRAESEKRINAYKAKIQKLINRKEGDAE